MSLKQGVLTVMSLMIGSGIFSTANAIHQATGSPLVALGIFLLTGLFSLTGALCYAELGTMIPGSGGEAQYLKRGIGSWAAALFDWTSIVIMKPGGLAVFSLPFASHMLSALAYIKQFKFFEDEDVMYKVETGIALGMIWFVTFAACASVKRCDQIVSVLTYSKLVALGAIILLGFINAFREPMIFMNNFQGAMSTKVQNFSFLKFSQSLYEGLFSFDGWNNLNIVAGSLSNPKRNLPLAIWISVCVVLALYLFTMLGYYAVLDDTTFMNTVVLAIDFGFRIFGKPGAIIFAILVCLSVFAAALSGMTTSSEIIILSAKNCYFPSFLGNINKKTGTAVYAYLSQGVIASLFLLIPRIISKGAFKMLIDVYTLPTWLFYGACVVVLVMMRFREPKVERPYKVWPTTPVMFLIACIWLVAVAFYGDWKLPTVAFSLVLGGVPIYMMRRAGMKVAARKSAIEYN